MHVELHCAACDCSFTPQDAKPGKVWEQIREEGPWSALGDGATIEDDLHLRLDARGGIQCPECSAPVELTEESLAQLSLDLLDQW